MSGGSPQGLQRDLTNLFQTGTASGLTDRELIARIFGASADEADATFELLVMRHGPMVLRVCRNILRDPHDAEDAFQATFLVLIQQFRTIRRLDSVGSWLYGVAVRVSERARVEAAKRRNREREHVRLAVVAEPDHDVFQGVVVQEEVLRLPERYRSVVVLCYWEGLTHEQAAARLDCPLGTVRSRVARAREMMRRRLIQRGLAPDLAEAGPSPMPALPSALVQGTVQAASKLIGGQSLSQVAAAHVAGPSLHVVRRMTMTKIGMFAAPACLTLVASIGLGLAAQTEKRVERKAHDQQVRSASPSRKSQPPPPELKPYIIEPPDLLLVEVLEALPGRPISGERLVRPDGKVSLGFYGDVYVAGLTIPEAKEKIVLRMQKFLTDSSLGLEEQDPNTGKIMGTIEPRDSDRVFVDVTAYNSKNYYIQGEVNSPGRIPVTGKETILDALHFAGGLTPHADHEGVVLMRNDPTDGSLKSMKIDVDEILYGDDASTNYYLQAGDRLVIRRDQDAKDDPDRSAGGRSAASFGADNTTGSSSDRPRITPGRDVWKREDVDQRLNVIEDLLRQVLEKLDRN